MSAISEDIQKLPAYALFRYEIGAYWRSKDSVNWDSRKTVGWMDSLDQEGKLGELGLNEHYTRYVRAHLVAARNGIDVLSFRDFRTLHSELLRRELIDWRLPSQQVRGPRSAPAKTL